MVIKNQTLAEVMSNSKLTADGSIAVWSEDSQTLYVIAGAAGAAISFTPGASVSGAAGVAVVRAENIVRAQVQILAELTAYGNAGISFYTGTLDGSKGNRRRKRQMQEQVFVSSFNHISMQHFKELCPDIETGLLYDKPYLDMEHYVQRSNADNMHPRYMLLQYQPELMELFHGRGMKVNTWTVNDEENMKDMIARGVDCIISNHPDVLCRVADDVCD